jgi:hypothetical protein
MTESFQQFTNTLRQACISSGILAPSAGFWKKMPSPFFPSLGNTVNGELELLSFSVRQEKCSSCVVLISPGRPESRPQSHAALLLLAMNEG